MHPVGALGGEADSGGRTGRAVTLPLSLGQPAAMSAAGTMAPRGTVGRRTINGPQAATVAADTAHKARGGQMRRAAGRMMLLSGV